jgi:hypothetical protein
MPYDSGGSRGRGALRDRERVMSESPPRVRAIDYDRIAGEYSRHPEMQVAGGGSSDAMLRWYTDRVSGEMPSAGVVSLPLWTYRVVMLAWALWLAASLVRAVGWGWRAFGSGGFWRPIAGKRPSVSVTPAPGEDGPPNAR